uniref:Insulinoma-associated protein 2-like n=1 Tax=Sinocyclocheilus anshuiensis TaxID=1608454 RepID=A0A671KE35_9TELE
MPRGFLVKRSKRASSTSYKVRAQEEKEPRKEDLSTQTQNSDYAQSYFSHPEQSASSPRNSTDSYSPIKPISTELLDRCLSSPAMAESFPLVTPVSSIERLLMNHSAMKFGTPVPSSLPPYPAFHQCVKRAFMDSERKSKPPKKPKVIRKLNFEDEVTTSPVLGLKIKKECPESKLAPQSGRKKPLGEFICQLCKEEYSDPFSLAQHKCSRIVRVEYRCPECDKVFSCPANLASHRRWHKPRMNNQHQLSLDSSQHHRSRYPSSEKCFEMHIVFECHYCSKKFRRQAYLRKHLAAHETIRTASYGHIESGQITFPCHLCGAHFPSVEIREKHRLWHAQIFSCKHCPSTFFSSPGLTRHINKTHPTENRQVMLLQMAVRPGC